MKGATYYFLDLGVRLALKFIFLLEAFVAHIRYIHVMYNFIL